MVLYSVVLGLLLQHFLILIQHLKMPRTICSIVWSIKIHLSLSNFLHNLSVKLDTHGDSCGERRDDKGHCHQDPRDYTKVESAEEIDEPDSKETTDSFKSSSDKGLVG